MGSREANHLLENLIKQAIATGADEADAVLFESAELSVSQRLGKPEGLERAESNDLGLRVIIDQKQACVSTTDLSHDSLDRLVEMAVSMARAVPKDNWCGLADKQDLITQWPELDLEDPVEPHSETLIDLAAAAEETARGFDGITNSNGASAGWSCNTINLMTSHGFSGSYTKTQHSCSVAVVAGSGADMQRAGEYTSALHGEDLDPPDQIGQIAAERALAKLNPRKAATQKAPVVYDPKVAKSLLSHLAGAIRGSSIARGTSLLKDSMGKQVMNAGLYVIDDPLRIRGLRSKPFDGEGLAPQVLEIISNGVLQNWILDNATARQLGLKSNGHASRGTSSPPIPAISNLYLRPGEKTPEDLIASVENGFYVTELMGSSVNLLTGDYSRGAAGFWIENGEIAWPVSEVTIAGNLADMWMNMIPANDLQFRYGINTPTLLVDGMTIAGS